MKINDKHLCMFAMSNAPTDFEGYLLKKGETNKSYLRRWFVLKGNLLFYFEKKDDKEPIGLIILENYTVQLAENTDAFAFEISFKGNGCRSYILAADSQEMMEKWMRYIARAGYDFMKSMVSELQRQVEVLNLADQHKNQVRSKQTQQDIIKGNDVKRTSANANCQSELLIDLSDAGISPEQYKRQGRVNPFDLNPSSDLLGFEDLCIFFGPTAKVVTSQELNVRDFEQMHSDFGKLIKENTRSSILKNSD